MYTKWMWLFRIITGYKT